MKRILFYKRKLTTKVLFVFIYAKHALSCRLVASLTQFSIFIEADSRALKKSIKLKSYTCFLHRKVPKHLKLREIFERRSALKPELELHAEAIINSNGLIEEEKYVAAGAALLMLIYLLLRLWRESSGNFSWKLKTRPSWKKLDRWKKSSRRNFLLLCSWSETFLDKLSAVTKQSRNFFDAC